VPNTGVAPGTAVVDLCATSHYASAAVAAPAPKQSAGARRILADRPRRRRRSAIKVQHDGERPRAVLTRGPRRTVHGHRKPRSSATPDSGGGGDCGNDRFSASVLGAQTSASTAKVLPYVSWYQAIRLPPARAAPISPRSCSATTPCTPAKQTAFRKLLRQANTTAHPM
jgi:hypothetical protein